MCFGNVAAFLWPLLLAGVAADRPLENKVNGTVAGLIEERMVRNQLIFKWVDQTTYDFVEGQTTYNAAVEKVYYESIVDAAQTHLKECTLFTRVAEGGAGNINTLLEVFDSTDDVEKHRTSVDNHAATLVDKHAATLTCVHTNIVEWGKTFARRKPNSAAPSYQGKVVYHSVHNVPLVGEAKHNVPLVGEAKLLHELTFTHKCTYAFFRNSVDDTEFHWHFVCPSGANPELLATDLEPFHVVKFTHVGGDIFNKAHDIKQKLFADEEIYTWSVLVKCIEQLYTLYKEKTAYVPVPLKTRGAVIRTQSGLETNYLSIQDESMEDEDGNPSPDIKKEIIKREIFEKKLDDFARLADSEIRTNKIEEP